MTVLAELRIDQPAERWLRQLSDGPTLAARVQAARALGRLGAGEGSGSLRRAADDRTAHRIVRGEAVRALAARNEWELLGALVNTANDTPDIRESLCNAVAESAARDGADPGFRDFAARTLERRSSKDPSTRVQAAAIRGLARLRAEAAWPAIVRALNTDSQDDRLRQAALESLPKLGRAEGLGLAIDRVTPGNLSRTRPIAIQAVVDLASHDADAAFQAIAPLLADREVRTRDAAGEALAKLKDPRGVAVLEAFIAESRDRRLREKARGWLEDLRRDAVPVPDTATQPAPAALARL